MNSMHTLEVIAGDPDYLYDKKNIEPVLLMQVEQLISDLKELNLPVSLKKAQSLRATLSLDPSNKQAAATIVQRYISELRERIEAELEGRVFYAFFDHVAYLTETEPLFGKKVDDAFPKTTEDVSEAGKCLALGRSTAAVFHLMRAMEVCVQVLYSRLSLTGDPERAWGNLLSDIGKAIEAMPKGDDKDAWSASHSHLYHVKQAWRNDVMHPKQTYTPEEAKEVFDAVKSFMRHLAGLV